MCLSEFTLASEMERLEILLAARRERIAVRAVHYPVTRAIPHAAGRPSSSATAAVTPGGSAIPSLPMAVAGDLSMECKA